MSAAEVIEMIKKLPPNEKAEVFAYARKAESSTEDRPVRYLPQAEVERIAEKVFSDHKELFRRLAQ